MFDWGNGKDLINMVFEAKILTDRQDCSFFQSYTDMNTHTVYGLNSIDGVRFCV